MVVVTWNPTDKGTSTNLSNRNLTATPIYQTSSVKSTISQNKGKWYCEIKIDALNINCIGIGKPTLPMTSAISASTDFYYYYADGRKGNSGVVSAYGSAMAVNSIIGILVDFDIGTLTFYKDGVSQGVAFTDIKKLGEFVIIASSGALSGTGGVTANFGATPFAYPPDKTKLPFGVKSYDGSQVLTYEQKTMIKDDEGYKALSNGWELVSTTLPTAQQFLEKGIDPLDILNRDVQDASRMNMTDKSEILNGETGLVFGATIDLKKYFDLRSIRTEVK